MKNIGIITRVLIIILGYNITLNAQTISIKPTDSVALSALDGKFNFIIANDLGRNGYYDQKPVAEMMGEVVALTGSEFVAAIGDIHHFMGVQSVTDPLWLTNFEQVYSHPELMIPWYPVLGNHEYKGNTKAVLNYSSVSRRWQMPATYYTKQFSVSDSASVLLVFINTVPLIDKYRNHPNQYPDAANETIEKQLKWIDDVLKNSQAKWKIVMGHHPLYSGTTKDIVEQTDLQKRLQPILDKYNTDLYVCGHIHNFQHIKIDNSNIDYIVNTSASLTRKVVSHPGMLYSSSDSGFIVCSVEDAQLIVSFVNKLGKIIYQHKRKK